MSTQNKAWKNIKLKRLRGTVNLNFTILTVSESDIKKLYNSNKKRNVLLFDILLIKYY